MHLAFRLTILTLIAAWGGSAAAAESFEILKPGDRELACPAIAAEVNTLNTAAAKRQEAAQAKAKRAESGRKLLGFAANAAPMLAGRAGSLGGMYAAQAAASAMQQGQMNPMTQPAMDAAPAPELARVEHLTQIYNEKGC